MIKEEYGYKLSELRLKVRGLTDWEGVWKRYMNLPSGTSVLAVRNDTNTSETVYARHPWGNLGGSFGKYDDKITLGPSEVGLLQTNRHGWGLGEGVNIWTTSREQPESGAVLYKHGEILTVQSVERDQANQI